MLNDEILHKWVKGQLSEEELEQFKLRPEYESLEELHQQTSDFSAPDFDQDAMLSNILKQKKNNTPPTSGRRVFLSNWVKYGVAASLLLLAAWIFFPGENMVRYEVAQEGIEEGALPDGSTFILNAESSLSFNADDWESNRMLDLEGEAFFDVEKGSKFRVVTSNGSVQVLGTKFNVRSRDKTIEVKCNSGKVAVISTSGKVLQELNPNDVVRVKGENILEKWTLGKTEQKSWMNGVFRFRKVPLATVLEELERQFGIKINAQNIDSQEVISCNFQNKNLELALKTTLSPLEIKYKIGNDKTVNLSK